MCKSQQERWGLIGSGPGNPCDSFAVWLHFPLAHALPTGSVFARLPLLRLREGFWGFVSIPPPTKPPRPPHAGQKSLFCHSPGIPMDCRSRGEPQIHVGILAAHSLGPRYLHHAGTSHADQSSLLCPPSQGSCVPSGTFELFEHCDPNAVGCPLVDICAVGDFLWASCCWCKGAGTSQAPPPRRLPQSPLFLALFPLSPGKADGTALPSLASCIHPW